MFEKKILCIGAEIQETDRLVSKIADINNAVNFGLIDSKDFVPTKNGYYHTTVVDLNEGQIKKLTNYFDLIVFLDQDKTVYPHFKSFLRTFRLFKELDQENRPVEYLQNKNCQQPEYWWNFLRQNPSFCFQPFLALVPDTDYTNICPKSKQPIKIPTEIVDWRTDPDYRKLRDPMLQGKHLPNEFCGNCYERERLGVESARQFETLEWAVRLDLRSPEDFDSVADPIFYEIRPSNKCNIMCRMCDDARSHLIEKERIQLKLPLMPYRFKDYPFERIKLDTVQRIYVGGGEPTIMPEFYDFLQKCISQNQTDFELCIGTNGMKISNKLLDLLGHFSDVVLSFSFDGYGIINDYIRWKSKFEIVRDNAKLLESHGHKIAMQTVPSMYNITRMHEIFEFYDNEFPHSSCLIQAAGGHDGVVAPWNHPRNDLVVRSMEKCMKTEQYSMNGRSFKSYMDSFYAHYSDPNFTVDKNLLRGFFEFNDQMDQARGSRLGDYIPELEACRYLIK